MIGLLALQGVVGGVQWWLELPSELVWVHVTLAVGTWLAMLWAVATAGRLEPRHDPATSETRATPRQEPEPAPKAPQPAA